MSKKSSIDVKKILINIAVVCISIFLCQFFFKRGGIPLDSIWLYISAAIGEIIDFAINYFIEKKGRTEYNKFEEKIENVIIKRNPVENRKAMDDVLVEYCKEERDNCDASVEEVILALIDQFRGEIHIGEMVGNRLALAYSVLCCGVTIWATAFLKDELPVQYYETVVMYGYILLIASLVLAIPTMYQLKRRKRSNNEYILSFLESKINDEKQLKEIHDKVDEKCNTCNKLK